MLRSLGYLTTILLVGSSLRAGELDSEYTSKTPPPNSAVAKATVPMSPAADVALDHAAIAQSMNVVSGSELDSERPSQAWGFRGGFWRGGFGGWGHRGFGFGGWGRRGWGFGGFGRGFGLGFGTGLGFGFGSGFGFGGYGLGNFGYGYGYAPVAYYTPYYATPYVGGFGFGGYGLGCW